MSAPAAPGARFAALRQADRSEIRNRRQLPGIRLRFPTGGAFEQSLQASHALAKVGNVAGVIASRLEDQAGQHDADADDANVLLLKFVA